MNKREAKIYALNIAAVAIGTAAQSDSDPKVTEALEDIAASLWRRFDNMGRKTGVLRPATLAAPGTEGGEE